MKIKKLELHSTRGIVGETLEPNCESIAIYGPNGQGKSAVIDGLDFLLTGTISRLTGEGGKDLSLKRHGPHITTTNLLDSFVKGVFVVKNGESVNIERSFSDPNNVVISGSKTAQEFATKALNVASNGQHILTRREILQFVTSTGKDRAVKIQNLLKLQKTENLRLVFKKIQNEYIKKEDIQKGIFLSDKSKVLALVGLNIDDNFDQKVLDFVNAKRAILGSDSTNELQSSHIFDSIKPITHTDSDKTVTLTKYSSAIKLLNNFSSSNKHELELKVKNLLNYKLTANTATSELEKQVQITNLAVELMSGGKCPVCETKWDIEKLHSLLTTKKTNLDKANKEYKSYIEDKDQVLININPLIVSLKNLTTDLKLSDKDILVEWYSSLLKLKSDIECPISEIDRLNQTKDGEIQKRLTPDNLSTRINQLLTSLNDAYPKVTPEQDAWDTLTQMKTLFEGLESSKSSWETALLAKSKSEFIYLAFEKARDEIIQKVYDSINDEFMSYYKFLNDEDESAFKSKLVSDGAGLDFEVDFYGFGENPPHALHSEGHQDSMGICIFLALSKKFTENSLDIIMLDDVVMSIDSDHRSKFAELLRDKFQDKQFIITTHEKVWAKQLKQKNVTKYNIEFAGWSPTKGPNTSISKNWRVDLNELLENLNRGKDDNSIGLLRKTIEEQFLDLCINLRTKTVIKLDNNYTAGDLVQPTIKRFKDILKETSKNTNNKLRTKEWCENLITAVDKIKKELDENEWMVNPSTHYTDWENFVPKEKIKIITLYTDLLDCFYCVDCKYSYWASLESDSLLCKCNS